MPAKQTNIVLIWKPTGGNLGGNLDVSRLPYGVYRLDIAGSGFAPVTEIIAVRTSIPVTRSIALKIVSVEQTVAVQAEKTLLDPEQPGNVDQVGSSCIQHRLNSIPGRSLEDLVNSQPGWLYEGNAVLHPRGSEYQTQFVVDGIPLTDNRSPSFGPEIEADEVQSLSIYTAGIPAEYGRKMGGVVEVNTVQNAQPGFHGHINRAGGSFDTGSAFARGQYTAGKNTVGGSASGSMTAHYLNPVVPRNYSNSGTLGDFSGRDQRDLSPSGRRRTGSSDSQNSLVAGIYARVWGPDAHPSRQRRTAHRGRGLALSSAAPHRTKRLGSAPAGQLPITGGRQGGTRSHAPARTAGQSRKEMGAGGQGRRRDSAFCMRSKMALFRRILSLGRRSRMEQEIDAELREHIAMRIHDSIARGMSRQEAERDVPRRFGSPAAMRERVSAEDAALGIETLWHDLRGALRVSRPVAGSAMFLCPLRS